MTHLELEIEGMTCSHCVAAVSQALKDLPGVKVQAVSVGSAQLSFEPERISRDDIVLAVEDAGYAAQPKG